MKRLLVIVTLILAFPSAAHPQPRGVVFVWGSTISSESLGPSGSHMLIGPFHSFNACIAFLALMQREGAGLGFVGPSKAILDVIGAGELYCVQVDSRGNIVMHGQASGDSAPLPDHGWMAGGFNSKGYFFGIGPVRARESCSTILGTMYREGAGFAYVNPGQTVTQVVLPTALSCLYV